MRPVVPPLSLLGLRGEKVSPRVTSASDSDRKGALGGGLAGAGAGTGTGTGTDDDPYVTTDGASESDGEGIDGAAGFVMRPKPGT